MRRKATAKKASERGAQGDANINIIARDNTALRLIKETGRFTKTPTGKGLGKAGAKRLGRLLKRAIQDQEESTEKSLPKTPVRLFKHHIQTGADNVSDKNAAQTKSTSPPVSQLILSMVSHCKHRGRISMAELRQTLAAGGYNVTKTNRRLKVVTTRMVNNETHVPRTRNTLLRLNSKKILDTTRLRMGPVKAKPNRDLKQSKTAGKSPKGAEKSQRRATKTPKPQGKSHKLKGKTSRRAAKSHKPRGNTRKPAGRSHKPTGRIRKPAGRSHKSRRRVHKARRKSPKPAGKKRAAPKKQAAQVRKAPMKTQRSRRRQPKQRRHLYKYSQRIKPASQRLPKTRSRRRASYY